MKAEYRDNLSIPYCNTDHEAVARIHEDPEVNPERYRPPAQLVDYCAAVFKRPEARKRMLASVTLFIKRGLAGYSQMDF